MTAVVGIEVIAQQVQRSGSWEDSEVLMINYRQLRRAQRLAQRARTQQNGKKWDVANRIMARATGRGN